MRIIDKGRKDAVRLRVATRVLALVLVAGTVALSLGDCAVGCRRAGRHRPSVRPKDCHHRVRHMSRAARQQHATKIPASRGSKCALSLAQLKAFRAQTRGDPDAVGYMWGMAGELDDATVDALAAYYAEQKPEASSAGRDAALVARGREIFEHGIQAEGVPACSSCHGPDAHGLQDFPRLAGQHAQYVLKQLASFQSNMRNVAIMHGVAQNLRLPEMQAVAAYLEAQP